MSIPSIEMNTGDLSPSIVATLQNSDGSIFNLTGCTVLFQMSQQGQILFSHAALVTNASGGVVQYNWQQSDTEDVYGVCTGQFIVTLSGGAIQSFPTVGVFYIIFPIQPVTTSSTLPQFTTFSDVMGHLNVQGPDSTGNYTVYGLPVSQQGIQAQVDHANTYINSLVASVTSTDPRYPFAQLAALDLACMSVLVAASGGVLLGAADYKLGDLFVTKGTVEKFALQSAVQSFHDSFSRNLMNLSTVALGAEAQLGREVPRYRGPLMNP
jgi:hypothetical protein